MTLRDVLTPLGGDQVMVRGEPAPRGRLRQGLPVRDEPAAPAGGAACRAASATACCWPAPWPSPANVLVLDEPDQRPRHGHPRPPGGPAGRLRGHPDPGQPRPRLHRPAGHLDHRPGRPGRAVETPGGWQDFLGQNPGFFGPPPAAPVRAARRPTASPRAEAAPRPSSPTRTSGGWRSSKRWLGDLPAEIAARRTRLADPGPLRPRPGRLRPLTAGRNRRAAEAGRGRTGLAGPGRTPRGAGGRALVQPPLSCGSTSFATRQ